MVMKAFLNTFHRGADLYYFCELGWHEFKCQNLDVETIPPFHIDHRYADKVFLLTKIIRTCYRGGDYRKVNQWCFNIVVSL